MKAKRLASINGDSDTNLLLVQRGHVSSTISGRKLLVGRDVELQHIGRKITGDGGVSWAEDGELTSGKGRVKTGGLDGSGNLRGLVLETSRGKMM